MFDYADKLDEIEEALDQGDFDEALQHMTELRTWIEAAQEKGKN